jgi:hypothetical protein
VAHHKHGFSSLSAQHNGELRIGAQLVPDSDEIGHSRANYTPGQSSSCCGLSASECFVVLLRRCLLISGSKVRVLDGPPNESGTSKISAVPDSVLVTILLPLGRWSRRSANEDSDPVSVVNLASRSVVATISVGRILLQWRSRVKAARSCSRLPIPGRNGAFSAPVATASASEPTVWRAVLSRLCLAEGDDARYTRRRFKT